MACTMMMTSSMGTGCVPQSTTGIHKHRVCGSELLEGKLAVEAEEGGVEEGDHQNLANAHRQNLRMQGRRQTRASSR
jgi:hypothetical protein